MGVKEIFETMDYGPAPEAAGEALAWIVDQGSRFGQFIDGKFTATGETFESRNPATGEVLAHISQATAKEVDAAMAAARRAQPKWAKLGGHGRARVLYALARMMQKHARLLAVLETMDNGKPIRESRDIDLPLVARHFYYHAGLAQLMEAEAPGMEPLGVCGQVIPWNFPLLMLAWKVAPALAAGNTVVLKPAEYTSLTALCFADICRQAGVPKGVVNIVTGDGAVGEMIVTHEEVDKVAFTGSTEVGRKIRVATAGQGKALTLELGGKGPYVVFDDADLDSAVEGLVDAIWFNQGQVCCAGSRLLVQEGVAERFHAKLRARMDKLRVGDPLDKCIDVGAVVDPVQLETIRSMVAGSGGEIYRAACDVPEGCYYPPTLITGLAPSDRLMQEEIFGPVLVSCSFRTPEEAVALANNTRYGLAASVWTENVNLALGIAPKLVAGVVWINGTNMFDAAAGFGGVRESGFGREGGWEGLSAYLRPVRKLKPVKPVLPVAGDMDLPGDGALDRTAKLYIGGKQARPDGGYSKMIYAKSGTPLGHVGIGSRKDIRNAVEAAQGAKGWSGTTGHLRAQILYYIAENLEAREAEFAARIDAMCGGKGGATEVETAVKRLFTYAAWADKYAGDLRSVPIRGMALAVREPVGVIGAICPDEAPLLGLVSVMGPAIAMGNRVVLVPSEAYPLTATDFYQVLDTSDVPGGVVNIVTGSHAELGGTLAAHLDVEAVWCFSSTDLSEEIEAASAGNLKRVWVNNGMARDWAGKDGEGRTFLDQATEVKTVWVPYGE
ncbi:aldehyde dehydrogenase family protein [Pseudooceanicola sp. C21-150M6]|uniref:aldehyde dehydrogenase family protein n=1 Tax=Pseudooceanicola sp. C21-150M6 TaxID=3434355 RepID=UPI003D7FD644